MRKFLREAFSEKGIGSAKRVMGSIALICGIGCVIYLTIKDGATSITEGLIQTVLIIGASLLGLYSIASIWSKGSVSVTQQPEDHTQSSPDPCTNCPHNKNK